MLRKILICAALFVFVRGWEDERDNLVVNPVQNAYPVPNAGPGILPRLLAVRGRINFPVRRAPVIPQRLIVETTPSGHAENPEKDNHNDENDDNANS